MMIRTALHRKNYLTPGHPTAFSGITNVQKFNNLSRRKTDEILSTINSYTLHREYKKPRTTNPYYVYFLREHIQVDLIDFRALSKFNGGVNYIICAIDLFSRKLFVRTLKTKGGIETCLALTQIIDEMGGQIKKILCDRGSELKNQHVKRMLQNKGIKLLFPSSPIKAGVVERVNRSLQNLIYKCMTENETRKYVDKLTGLVQTYNARIHRKIKMSPDDAELDVNELAVRDAHNIHYTNVLHKKKKPKYKINDVVRIKLLGNKFQRGYEEQFSRETFKVVEVKINMPIPMYILQSLNSDEIISGGFYSNELQKIKTDIFKVEKVLKRRIRKGVPQIYVKWLDYDNRHNSWTDEANVTDIYN